MNPTLEIKSPLTFETLGTFTVDDDAQVQKLLDTAESAFSSWRDTPISERVAYCWKLKDIIYEHRSELIDIISKTTGKPKVEALTAEIIPVLDLITYFSKKARHVFKKKSIPLHLFVYKKSEIYYEPYGVVAILSPWNYPFSIAMGEIILAILAGNTVIVKPSEFVFPIAKNIKELIELAGFPKGVVNICFGEAKAGQAIITSPIIRKISFTGSTQVGQKILEQAAKNLTPCLLELGGKDAALVCQDANLDLVADGLVWGGFTNSGQVCASVQRVYVEKPIAEELIDKIISKTKSLKMTQDLGAITLSSQLDRYDVQLDDAIQKGAKIRTGGKRVHSDKGYFYEPTVLTNVKDDMRAMTEETFGPLLPIQEVNSIEEAIQKINHSSFGLCASVWTKDVSKGLSIAKKIEAGTITINDCVFTHALCETPWGGIKKSGIGRTHSIEGLKEFVQMKHVNYSRIPVKPFWWFPYTEGSYAMASALCDFLGRRSIVAKMQALIRFTTNYISFLLNL